MDFENKKANSNLDEARVDAARTAILDYIQSTGKSQAEVGKELGYSSGSRLNQFLSNTHVSIEIVKKIEQLLKISAKREAAPKKPPYQETSTSRRVAKLIERCHTRGEMGVAYGDPGVGKTMAIREYAKENPDAIVVTVSPTTANITGINELLAAALDIKEKGSRRITAGVIAKLKGETKRVIIVDEAQHLKAKVVNHLRSIVDATEDEDTGERIGMALVGNFEIFFELKVKQQAAYRQVADRISYWELLEASEVKLDDMHLIFKDSGLKNDVLELLHHISKMVSVRKAVQVYTNTLSTVFDDAEDGIMAGHISAVALKMGVNIKSK
jgi:DNA transposition AAA+ family ATPase